MTAREIIKKRLRHEGTDITPFAVEFEPQLYQRLSEYFKDEHWEKKLLRQFAATYLYVDTVQMHEISDMYSQDGYGSLWKMDRKPWHLEKPPLDEPTLNGYDFPSPEKFVNPILQNKKAAIELYNNDNEHYRVISMGWGVFEHTWRLRGFENALVDTMMDVDFYKEMTENITDLYIDMLKACEDVPADAFLFGDDWGEQRGVIIGAEKWRELIKPCWERIYKEVHRQGKAVLQHSCGSIVDIYDDLAEIDCHESVQPEARGMAPEIIKKKWGSKISFWGCLGSQGILNFGTPNEIKAEIFRLRDLFKKDGGYILAPAKPLQDEMSIDKAVAVVEALSELNN
jgi:uroporphyrinogen decarboxylase